MIYLVLGTNEFLDSQAKGSFVALPIVSIIGRPNVGKSSLLNRLAQTKAAIVHEERGVTRDRTYHTCEWNGREFMLVDTGGIEMPSKESDQFSAHIRASATAALEESDVILFLVDAELGIQEEDAYIAKLLKASDKPVFLLANKLDTPSDTTGLHEFWALGLGEPYAISALHGHGTGDLLDEVVTALPEVEEAPEKPQNVINVALVGRPNVGKSTLLNRLAKADVSVVSDIAGTTRDSIDTTFEHAGTMFRFIDTAGIKRHAQHLKDIDYFSYVRALRSIDEADVCLLLIDSAEGMCEQDQKISNAIIERGCGLIILTNKFDLVQGDTEAQARLDDSLARRGTFVSWAPRINISAETGRACSKIWDELLHVFQNVTRRIPTAKLNNFLQEIKNNSYTVTQGKQKLTLTYVTQPTVLPPTFAFFCNHPKLANDTYKRYLENRLRDTFDFVGSPIRMKFRSKQRSS